MQQPAGRITDEDEQGAFWTPVLKPPVMRAVDLHQLAETVRAVRAADLRNCRTTKEPREEKVA